VIYFAEYNDQLLVFGVIHGALGLEAKALADLKANLDKEKTT
jgi:hypothetical protein